jgi:hypothetical protein
MTSTSETDAKAIAKPGGVIFQIMVARNEPYHNIKLKEGWGQHFVES